MSGIDLLGDEGPLGGAVILFYEQICPGKVAVMPTNI
jgi:hypothetical protein